MTLTKSEIADTLVSTCGLGRTEAEDVSQMFFDKIKERLSSGEDVLLSGFGKWTVKEKKARRGRNPHTGQSLELPARTVVTWKYSPLLRKALNGNG